MAFKEPPKNCSLCNRLNLFRLKNMEEYPTFFNAPVPSFGSLNSNLLIVGLAPGLKGANRTGKPFTGDYAGNILYETLIKYKLASGNYSPEKNNKLRLNNCRITNSVKCLPPKNKPNAEEINNCRRYLINEINYMSNLKIILTLGTVAHKSIISALNIKQKEFIFKHGEFHKFRSGLIIANSYHCSKYNTSTKRLTKDMFEKVFEKISIFLKR